MILVDAILVSTTMEDEFSKIKDLDFQLNQLQFVQRDVIAYNK